MPIGCMLSIKFDDLSHCANNHEIICDGSEEEKRRCPEWSYYNAVKEFGELYHRLRR